MALRAIWQFTDWAIQARMVYGPIFYESKGCHMCRMMRVVTIYLCKHSITPVLSDILQQFDPDFHSDLMTA